MILTLTSRAIPATGESLSVPLCQIDLPHVKRKRAACGLETRIPSRYIALIIEEILWALIQTTARSKDCVASEIRERFEGVEFSRGE
jgi:hypothetical protein